MNIKRLNKLVGVLNDSPWINKIIQHDSNSNINPVITFLSNLVQIKKKVHLEKKNFNILFFNR